MHDTHPSPDINTPVALNGKGLGGSWKDIRLLSALATAHYCPSPPTDAYIFGVTQPCKAGPDMPTRSRSCDSENPWPFPSQAIERPSKSTETTHLDVAAWRIIHDPENTVASPRAGWEPRLARALGAIVIKAPWDKSHAGRIGLSIDPACRGDFSACLKLVTMLAVSVVGHSVPCKQEGNVAAAELSASLTLPEHGERLNTQPC